MTDEIQLLRERRPIAHGPARELRDEHRRELLDAIGSTPAPRRFHGRRAVSVLTAATALVAGIFVGSDMRSNGEVAWAAPLVRVAQAAPRLLVAAPGWKVTRADQFSAEIGEMTFGNGRRTAELHWQPVRDHAATVRDRSVSADLDTTTSVLGVEARLFRYAGTDDYTALWIHERHGLEFRGRAPSVEAFNSTLASLRQVDVDTWLTAMPASVVRPSNRAEVVRRMLADVPLPPGFDSTSLEHGAAVRDRYQLGATVVSAVTCAWLERWVAAKRDGDTASAARAVAALQTSRNWTVLREMDDEGAYPEVLEQHVDALAGNGVVMGGKPLDVQTSWRDAFGCN